MNGSKSRRWAIALVASLALNLFLGGMFVASWGIQIGPRDDAAANPFAVFWARNALGEPAGAMLRRVWGRHAAEFRPRVREMRVARRHVSERLAAADFDRAALVEALADLRAKTLASQGAMHAALVDLAGELTVEERRDLAEVGRRRHRRQPPPPLPRRPPEGP
jgi:uncharacterized membrane protein